jgi:DNA-binding protein H-NS
MDLTVLSLTELQALDRKIADELGSRERAEITKAREQVLVIARNAGISLEELVGITAKPKKAQVAPQYENPENAGQQWSGRGRQPGWVKDWLAAGKPMDSLRIV